KRKLNHTSEINTFGRRLLRDCVSSPCFCSFFSCSASLIRFLSSLSSLPPCRALLLCRFMRKNSAGMYLSAPLESCLQPFFVSLRSRFYTLYSYGSANIIDRSFVYVFIRIR